jgi:hypothetical protein
MDRQDSTIETSIALVSNNRRWLQRTHQQRHRLRNQLPTKTPTKNPTKAQRFQQRFQRDYRQCAKQGTGTAAPTQSFFTLELPQTTPFSQRAVFSTVTGSIHHRQHRCLPYRCDYNTGFGRCWTWGQFSTASQFTGKAFAASYGGPVAAALTVAVLMAGRVQRRAGVPTPTSPGSTGAATSAAKLDGRCTP